jgi:hypothetical protein
VMLAWFDADLARDVRVGFLVYGVHTRPIDAGDIDDAGVVAAGLGLCLVLHWCYVGVTLVLQWR